MDHKETFINIFRGIEKPIRILVKLERKFTQLTNLNFFYISLN